MDFQVVWRGSFDRFQDMIRFDDSLITGFAGSQCLRIFGTDAFFANGFLRKAGEIEQKPPFVSVEIIERCDDRGVICPVIADPLSDASPVPLSHMRIILTVASPVSCISHRSLSISKMAEEVAIEEFADIIAIEAEQRERECRFDSLHFWGCGVINSSSLKHMSVNIYL